MKSQHRLLVAALTVSLGVPLALVLGQNPGFVPGGRAIVSLSFAGTAPGSLPAGVRVSGNLQVVDKDGVRMLRASSRSELLLQLPEVLPQDFTLEFDLIPKTCCNPEDLAFEGTTTISQSSTSANVLWHREHLAVLGGGDAYHAAMRPDLRDQLPGQLTTVAASFEGNTLKLYTNGQRLFTLTDRRFVRGRVLRVFLGGQDDGPQAVYLARVRVATGPPAPIVAVAATVAPPASAGALGSGPVVRTTSTTGSQPGATAVALPARTIALAGFTGTGGSSTMAARSIALAGFTATGGPNAMAPRTVTLAGFAAAGGFTGLAPRTLTLSGFIAVGGLSSLAPRTIALSGFTAAGGLGSLAPRTIALSGFTAAGGYSSVAPRTVTLSGFTAAGGFTIVAPRTITLSGFTAAAGFTSFAPRTVSLSGFTAAGDFPSLAPRTITLSGFIAVGSFTSLAPRTITLPGWTAVGLTSQP
jgi:hypothetical protein